MKPLNNSIINGIEGYMLSKKGEMVDALRSLVRIPSQSGINTEQGVAKELSNLADDNGLDVRQMANNPEHPNLIISDGAALPNFVLIGHMDTVPIGDEEKWVHAPLAGEITGGKLWGRGALDMKASLVSGLYSLAALKALEIKAQGQAALVAVSDEESGADSPYGTKYLVDSDIFNDARAAIYMEPSTHVIATGHRGVMRLTVHVQGESAHTGALGWQTKRIGANAVSGMSRIILSLEELRLPYEEDKNFIGYKPVITPGTTILGGSGINIVPDFCSATVDIRLLPNQNEQEIFNIVEDTCKNAIREFPKLSCELILNSFAAGASIGHEEPVVQSVKKWAERFLKRTPPTAVVGPANESYMLIKNGIPTICAFGPDGGNCHTFNEHVLVDSIPLVATIYALTTLESLGLSPYRSG